VRKLSHDFVLSSETKLDHSAKRGVADRPQRRLGSINIAQILRREIDREVLEPRSRVPPGRVLAKNYGVARGTIREALNQLANEALVEIRPGSGTYVTSEKAEKLSPIIEEASPLELIDARFALEPHMCRLAVLHARQQDLNLGDKLLATMEAHLSDPVAFSIADTAFHTLLAKTTQNRLLIWVISQINSVRNQDQWSRMRRITLNRTTIARYTKQHRQILEAIRSRAPEQAATLMKEHLETARLSLTRAAST